MTKFLQVIGLSCLLFLGSCGLSLFQAPDATPLLQIESRKTEVVLDLSDSVLELAKGLPADQRTLVEVEVAKQVAAYNALQGQTVDFLEAVGMIDWGKLYNDLRELYDQLRSGGQ